MFCLAKGTTTTIGASFLQKRIEIDHATVELQLWDTAGHERFRSMTPMYYRTAKAAVIVCDITNRDSTLRLQKWKEELKQYAEVNVVISVVLNKMDATPQLSDEEVRELEVFVTDTLQCPFFRTSAKTGEGVEELFSHLGREALKQHRAQEAASSSSSQGGSREDGNIRVCVFFFVFFVCLHVFPVFCFQLNAYTKEDPSDESCVC